MTTSSILVRSDVLSRHGRRRLSPSRVVNSTSHEYTARWTPLAITSVSTTIEACEQLGMARKYLFPYMQCRHKPGR